MPLRALGYLTSAAALAQDHLPKAQIQLVHTLHTAQRINGAPLPQTREQAATFAQYGRRLLRICAPDILDRLTFLTDPKQPADIDTAQVAQAIHATSPHIRDKLLTSGQQRQGDTAAYVAAHLQMHDTAAALLPLSAADAPPIVPHTIISVGAQSERPFYAVRMECRQQGVDTPDRVEQTAQVFTRHVLPPYAMCREGEPPLQLFTPDELADNTANMVHSNRSVQRDLQYLTGFVSGELGVVYA